MGAISRVRHYMDSTAEEIEGVWCEECYTDRDGPCPCDGEVDCPKCYRYADYMMLMSVVEECADRFLELL